MKSRYVLYIPADIEKDKGVAVPLRGDAKYLRDCAGGAEEIAGWLMKTVDGDPGMSLRLRYSLENFNLVDPQFDCLAVDGVPSQVAGRPFNAALAQVLAGRDAEKAFAGAHPAALGRQRISPDGSVTFEAFLPGMNGRPESIVGTLPLETFQRLVFDAAACMERDERAEQHDRAMAALSAAAADAASARAGTEEGSRPVQ